MNYLAQLSLLGLFLGAAVSLARRLPRRLALTVNAFSGGVILFFLITTVSDVITRLSELPKIGQAGPGYAVGSWIFAAATLLGIFGIPLLLVFIVKERRRPVVVAIALGLFNLAIAMKLASELFYGLSAVTLLAIVLLTGLFVLEGIVIGSPFISQKPAPAQVVSLVIAVVLAALAGFNIPGGAAPDYVIPFSEAVAAGFFLFYLPFSLTAGTNPNDVKWHFIGLLTGLCLTGSVVTALALVTG